VWRSVWRSAGSTFEALAHRPELGAGGPGGGWVVTASERQNPSRFRRLCGRAELAHDEVPRAVRPAARALGAVSSTPRATSAGALALWRSSASERTRRPGEELCELCAARAKPAKANQLSDPIGLMLAPGTNLDGWKTVLVRVAAVGNARLWWVGDLLEFGGLDEQTKYDEAEKALGYSRHRQHSLALVSRQIERARRRSELHHGHYEVVGPLEPDEQDRWRPRAIAERLTVNRLREGSRPSFTAASARRARSSCSPASVWGARSARPRSRRTAGRLRPRFAAGRSPASSVKRSTR
jgi:hypothetical protein